MSQERFNFFVYTQNKKKVAQDLATGNIDYGSFSKMGFVDEFFAFVLATDFLPSPKILIPAPGQRQKFPHGLFWPPLWLPRCTGRRAF